MKVDITNKINFIPSQNSPFASVAVINQNKYFLSAQAVSKKKDLSNNGKFDKDEAQRNFLKGAKKPFVEVYHYAKEKPGQFLAITSISLGLMALSAFFPPVGWGLTAIGCYFIGNPLVKGIKQMKSAKNGDDKEKAFAQFGESATYVLLTFGANVLSKISPHHSVLKTNKVAKYAHKGSKHTISFFSNATDVASFAPNMKITTIVAGKGLIDASHSYNASG